MRFQLFHFAKLDRIRRTRFRASRFDAIFHAVITERAFTCRMATLFVTRDHSERTGNDAIAAAVADILLHVDRVELRANNCPRRARFLARRVGAMLAHVTLHQPAVRIEKGQSGPGWNKWNEALASGLSNVRLHIRAHSMLTVLSIVAPPDLLDEEHMPPRGRAQLPGIIIARPCPARFLRWKLVPLLAGHLAGFAANTQTRISERSHPWLLW